MQQHRMSAYSHRSGIAKDIVISEDNLSDNLPTMEIKQDGFQKDEKKLSYKDTKPKKNVINKDKLRYLYWQGLQIFMLDGKIQFGINLWQPVCTFLIITSI